MTRRSSAVRGQEVYLPIVSAAQKPMLPKRRVLPICRVGRCSLVFLLIFYCGFASRSIQCQNAWHQVPVPAAAELAAASAWKPVNFSSAGFTASNKDQSSQVTVHGYMEADGRFFIANLQDQQKDVFLFRRVRPIVEGMLANHIGFRFMPDFGQGNAVIQEAYIAWRPSANFSLAMGKLKTPLGLEVLRSDEVLTFAERSMASDLLPVRDLGAQLDGSFFRDTIAYEAGFFSGVEDGANANFEWRGTNEAVGRIFLLPFVATERVPLQKLGLGVAVSAGHNHNAPPTFLTTGQESFFKYSPGVTAAGLHKRLAPQADYFHGPFGLLAEYAVSGQTLQTGSEHRYLSNRGWQLAGSIILTGERNSYDGIQPAHPFQPTHGFHHWGAWEIAFRHSSLAFDASTFPQYASPASSAKAAGESAGGVNWYVNRYIKFVANYEYTSFQMASDQVRGTPAERVSIARVQLAF